MSRELEVLRDDPKDYCVLLDLIQDRIDEIEVRYANH
jgi:hypothetical protein